MTNLLAVLVITLSTNWQRVGTIEMDGKAFNVKVGRIATNQVIRACCIGNEVFKDYTVSTAESTNVVFELEQTIRYTYPMQYPYYYYSQPWTSGYQTNYFRNATNL